MTINGRGYSTFPNVLTSSHHSAVRVSAKWRATHATVTIMSRERHGHIVAGGRGGALQARDIALGDSTRRWNRLQVDGNG
jgi:hypothetical protein